MRLSSENSYERALDRWEALLSERAHGEVELANELFAVAAILREAPSLTGALVDPSRNADARAHLIRSVLDGRVASEIVELVEGMARERWSEDADLPDSVERMGAQTLLIGAAREGLLDETEEQLFDIVRVLRSERELRLMLNDDYLDVSARQDLASTAFASVNQYAREAVAHGVDRASRRSLTATLRDYLDAAAARSEQLVAAVVSVIPLTQEQEQRLESILSRKYGKDIRVHVAIDPEIVGGLRISVGDDIIDGTLAKRISNVRESIQK